MSYILDDLKNYIKFTDENKSIFWQEILNNKNIDIENLNKNFGFGSFEKKNFLRSILHFFFSRYLFGLKIFKTKEYYSYKEIFDKMNRQIDTDAIRHIFTFEKLRNSINPKKVCIIGDGKSNFVIGSYNLFPGAKIFSINLAETLIHDYLILKKYKIIPDDEIQVVSNLGDMDIKNKRLFLIPANKKNLLREQNIDLFVNIVSFQEMNFKEVNSYFKMNSENK